MRVTRILVLLAFSAFAGCILTSGQFLVPFELQTPLTVTGPASLIRQPIDLNTISTYSDHKEDLKNVADAALLGEVEAVSTIDIEVWITSDLTSHVTSGAVVADPTATRLWGPLQLAAGERRRIDWDQSADLFVGRQALLDQVKSDGIFTLYVFGPTTGSYSFTLYNGVLVVVIDAGV
jgi:hypothetical protein